MKINLSPLRWRGRLKASKTVVLIVVAACAATLTTGIAAYVTAGASGSSTTYFACITSTGTISKVGTTAPTCPKTSTQISWNSQGPAGPQGANGIIGPQGPAGPSGLTNYQVAQENGYQGTLTQWLASLVGPQGITGAIGPTGPAGPQGPAGPSTPPVGMGTGLLCSDGEFAPATPGCTSGLTYISLSTPTVATLSLPSAGYWDVSSEGTAFNLSSSLTQTMGCALEQASTPFAEADALTLQNANTDESFGPISMAGVVHTTGPVTISLTCTSSNLLGARDVDLNAIQFTNG